MALQVGPPSPVLKGKPVDQWGAREVADTVLQDRYMLSMHALFSDMLSRSDGVRNIDILPERIVSAT